MKLLDQSETVVVVVGTGGRRPERDRALTDSLRLEIDRRGQGLTYRRAVVIDDSAFLERQELHRHPTITIGGPGVNQVAGYYVADLPTVWEDANRSFVQAELDGGLKRVALWGSDARATAAAVDAFVTDGHLEALLERIWRLRSDLVM
ncbi:MAG: hypothetical protein R2909_11565 [Gemmatimonadales bacterium]